MMDMIFSWICDGIAAALNAAVEFLLPLIGFDQTRFINTFPWAADAYRVFQSFAIGGILLVGVLSLIVALWDLGKNKIPPLRIVLSSMVAVFLVYFGNYFLEITLQLCSSPYDVLLHLDANNGLSLDFNLITGTIHSMFATASGFLYLIILILIGIAFIKLLLEVVERYIMLFALMYLSPILGWAPAASPYTSGITKKYFAMFISQCLIMMLNVWSLKMVISMFANVTAGGTDPVLSLVMGYAMLRIASRMDSTVNQLGFNAAITGAGLGGELLTAGMSVARLGQQVISKGQGSFTGGGFSGSGSPVPAGGVPGLAQKLGYGAKQVFPAAMFGEWAGGQAKSFGRAAADTVRGFHASYQETGSVRESGKQIWGNFKENMAQRSHDANLSAQDKVAAFNKAFGNDNIPYPPAPAPPAPLKPVGENGAPPTASQMEQYESAMKAYLPLKERREQYVQDVAAHGSRAAHMWDLGANQNFPLNKNRDRPDPELLSATIMGTGLMDAAPKEAVMLTAILNGQYDSGEVEDASFDQNGLRAVYTQGNQEWTVNGLNQDQFDSLSFSEQSAFNVRSTANDGKHYYYRFESAPLAADKPSNGKGNKPNKNPKGEE